MATRTGVVVVALACALASSAAASEPPPWTKERLRVSGDVDGDTSPDLLGHRDEWSHEDEEPADRWLVARSGRDGAALWQRDLDELWPMKGDPAYLGAHSDLVRTQWVDATASGRPGAILHRSEETRSGEPDARLLRLMSVDGRTGETLWERAWTDGRPVAYFEISPLEFADVVPGPATDIVWVAYPTPTVPDRLQTRVAAPVIFVVDGANGAITSFPLDTTVVPAQRVTARAVDDRTGDGLEEIAVTGLVGREFPSELVGSEEPRTHLQIVSLGSGAIETLVSREVSTETPFSLRRASVGDLTGDGVPELVAAYASHFRSDRTNMFIGDGVDATPIARFEDARGILPAGDVDGDGLRDAAAVMLRWRGDVEIEYVSGTGELLARSEVPGPWWHAWATTLPDVDGDGANELAVHAEVERKGSPDAVYLVRAGHPSTYLGSDIAGLPGTPDVWVADEHRGLGILAAPDLLPRWSAPWTYGLGVDTADFSGDGYPDLVFDGGPGLSVVDGLTGALVWQQQQREHGYYFDIENHSWLRP